MGPLRRQQASRQVLLSYRWVVLAVGTLGQASFAAFTIGLSVMLPQLQAAYGLSLTQTGLILAAANVGTMVGMLPWGLAADRFGERVVVSTGLTVGALATLAATRAEDFGTLMGLLALAGLGGASVSAASGRAVVQWFPRDQRGLALGIRQASVPVAGAVAAIGLPWLVTTSDVDSGLIAIGIGILLCAILAALLLRDAAPSGVEPGGHVFRDRRTWVLAGSSALLLVPQIALFGFVVLFLHDRRGLSAVEAGAVFAVVQMLAVAARILAGHWSDVVRSRIGPLRLLAAASAVSVAATAVVVDSALPVLVPILVAAGVAAASWNGLAYAAAAESAGRDRSGAALGFQQTILFGAGAAAAPLFAWLVDGYGWAWAFAAVAAAPMIAYAVLGRVRERAVRA